MNQRWTTLVLVCGLFALCVTLGGCDVQIDEGLLNAEANYNIDISLPYATVTPPLVARYSSAPASARGNASRRSARGTSHNITSQPPDTSNNRPAQTAASPRSPLIRRISIGISFLFLGY